MRRMRWTIIVLRRTGAEREPESTVFCPPFFCPTRWVPRFCWHEIDCFAVTAGRKTEKFRYRKIWTDHRLPARLALEGPGDWPFGMENTGRSAVGG